MEAIRLRETISDKGVLLLNLQLDKFINREVEIVISPVKTPSETLSFRDLAGRLTAEDAKIFEQAVADCRRMEDTKTEVPLW